MKTTTSVLAIAAWFSAGLSQIGAQDAPTRPLQNQSIPSGEEQVSPTPTATPKASPEKPTAKTTEKAATDPGSPGKAEETTKPASSPAKRVAKIEEKSRARAEKKAAAETMDEISSSPNAAVKLKAMEKEWEASFNDPVVIEKSVSDDFVGTSPDGKLVSKKSLLREAKINAGPIPTTVAHDLDVHFYGSNVAVVVGAAKQTGKNSEGKTLRHDYRFTDTWVLRDGKWQCVASQAILLPKK